MGIADAEYRFLWIQVGDVGSTSDGQIWNNCEVRQALQAGGLGIPDPDPLPGDDVDTPYYFVGDDTFGMRTWLMKPFSRRGMDHDERVFNYRLSRARRVVENAFGILANRFRCLLTTIAIDVDSLPVLVRTCVVLHNFLRTRNLIRATTSSGPGTLRVMLTWRTERMNTTTSSPVHGGTTHASLTSTGARVETETPGKPRGSVCT